MSSSSSSESTFKEWMTAEGLAQFIQPFQQFGVTSVETLAASKHDDVYLRFNVGIDDASELARFKRLRERAAGGANDNSLRSSSSNSSGSYASPLTTNREQLNRFSSAPARAGRRSSTTGAEGVALMQEWLATEGLSEFADPLDQFGVDSVAALAASQHDDVYLRFNVGLEQQAQLAKFKKLREQAKKAIETEEREAHAVAAARRSNRRASVGSAMPGAASSAGLEAQEAEQQLEEWERESLRSLEEQRRRESTILEEADRRRRDSQQPPSPVSGASSSSSSSQNVNELSKRRSGRSLEAMTSELASAHGNSGAEATGTTASGDHSAGIQGETLPPPQGRSRRVSWTENTADSSSGSSSNGGGSLGMKRPPPMLSKKSTSFRDMESDKALPEWLGGADLLKFQPSLEQFGITSVQTLAESTHDDVYLRFNVGLDDPAALARYKNLREMARDCLVEACAADDDDDDSDDDDDDGGAKQSIRAIGGSIGGGVDGESCSSSSTSNTGAREAEAAEEPSSVPPELAAASASASFEEVDEEKRVDPSDGGAYTRTEFFEEYGGYTEWDACAPKAAAAVSVSSVVVQEVPAELSALEESLASSDPHGDTAQAGKGGGSSNAGTSNDATVLPVEEDFSVMKELESCTISADDHQSTKDTDRNAIDLDSDDAPIAAIESEFEQTAAAAADAASEGEAYEAQGDAAQESEDWANGTSAFAKARDAYKRAADLTAKARELFESSGGDENTSGKKPTAASAMKWRRKATAAAAAFEECKANWV